MAFSLWNRQAAMKCTNIVLLPFTSKNNEYENIYRAFIIHVHVYIIYICL